MSKKTLWTENIARIIFALVFLINIQCALQFIFDPANYLRAYQLDGPSGIIAIQGIGVAFLMWNVTYPLYIFKPSRYPKLGFIILVQQLVGFVGESFIYMSIETGYEALQHSIARFMFFDGLGFVLMAIIYIVLGVCLKRQSQSSPQLKE